MRGAGCERTWELDAYREGRLGEADALSFERHLRSCAVCAGARSSDERLRDLARALPDEPSDTLRMRRVRRRILNDAAMGPSRARTGSGRIRVGVALALAVGSAAAIEYRATHGAPETAAAVAKPAAGQASSPAPSPFAGTIQADPGARWSQARERDVETVRLDEGTLSVHVRPQLVYERFLVSVPDGEIEVRGTTFDVTVEGGRTTGVRVAEGVVELRLASGGVRRIGANEAWADKATPGTEPQATRPRVAVPRETPRAEMPASLARTAGSNDGTAAYSEAMGLLGAGRNGQAAAALRAFAVGHPDAPQVEDATFLEAVALARAGRADAAGLAAEQHLARFPASFHRKEAIILVDRAARLRGDASSP